MRWPIVGRTIDGNQNTLLNLPTGGTATSAAKLTTARNIDGQAFDGTADVTVIAPGTHAATSKTTPVDADELSLVDSAASNVLKKLTWANLKATVKAYYDSVASTLTNKSVDLATNTVTGTTAQFNTALSDNDFATLAGTETLTGKTLTTPVLNGTPTGTGVATASTASALALRDSNAYLTASGYVSAAASTVTAAGTTTLDITAAQVQVFTGSTTQTVKLPTTSVVAGQRYIIVNQSSGSVTVQSSGANLIVSLPANKIGIFTAVVATPTTAANWIATAPSSSGSANMVATRDLNAWLFAAAFVVFPASTVTAAGTTTLTAASTATQVFTGSTTQTVLLPTTGIVAGQQYTICNQSSGSVTVQSSGANAVATVTTNTVQLFIAIVSTPTTAAHWRAI